MCGFKELEKLHILSEKVRKFEKSKNIYVNIELINVFFSGVWK